MHFFLVYMSFIFYFSSVNVIINRKILITTPKFEQKMTPAILLVISILTIHFRKQLFALLSFSDISIFGKESQIEVFLPSFVAEFLKSFDSYVSLINLQNNSLFIKILDRDIKTFKVLINSLEYPKTTDGLVYLTD